MEKEQIFSVEKLVNKYGNKEEIEAFKYLIIECQLQKIKSHISSVSKKAIYKRIYKNYEKIFLRNS